MNKLMLFVLLGLATACANAGNEIEMHSEGFAEEVDFQQIDPIVPQPKLFEALEYLEENAEKFENKNYMVLIDFGKLSSQKRFYLINLKTGDVESRLVAHGRGSDQNNDRRADDFSNTPESYQSSLGFFKTAETYVGIHGYSLRLDGLSESNSKARQRNIVIHPAEYVSETELKAGRSFGCPALDPRHSKRIITAIKDGALIYAFHSGKEL